MAVHFWDEGLVLDRGMVFTLSLGSLQDVTAK